MEIPPYIRNTVALEMLSGPDTVWRKAPGTSDYLVSNDGKVFSIKDNRRVKDRYIPKEGMKVAMVINGDRKYRMVHRLVAEVFLDSKPERGAVVKRKDGNLRNCHISNLEWSTLSEGKRKLWAETDFKGKSRGVRINETGQTFRSGKECGDHFGVGRNYVNRVLRGERQTLKGYTLSYLD